MDISRRLIGVSAVFSEDGKVRDVDLESLVRRLILFDCYVLHSIRLQEFPGAGCRRVEINPKRRLASLRLRPVLHFQMLHAVEDAVMSDQHSRCSQRLGRDHHVEIPHGFARLLERGA